jgi:hypothetical protein
MNSDAKLLSDPLIRCKDFREMYKDIIKRILLKSKGIQSKWLVCMAGAHNFSKAFTGLSFHSKNDSPEIRIIFRT